MKKRVLSLFMTLMLCLTSLPTTSFAEELVVANGTSTVETVDGEGKTAGEAEAGAESGKTGDAGKSEAGAESGKTGDEGKSEAGAETGKDGKVEAGAEGTPDEAVASVQDMIDALPDADALSTMNEDEVLAAYMAIQEAYDAYEALTAEQQVQITGADCFEELFGWFNGQVAPLAEGTVTSWGTVNENTGDIEPSTNSRTCQIVDDNTTVLTAPNLYMIPDNTEVDLTSLTVQGNRERSVYLYLGENAKLTINGPLTFQNGCYLFVYGAQDETGEIIINNIDASAAAIYADDVSAGSYLSVCSGTLKITSASGHITDGVELVNGNDSYRYMEYTIDGDPVAYNDDRVRGTAIEGKRLTLAWCDHDNATYKPSGDTQHTKECAQCGFVGKPYNCGTDGIDGYVSGGEEGHYELCACGNRIGTTPTPHTLHAIPTTDGWKHITGCEICGYTTGTPEDHNFYGERQGECTECGFAPVAEDNYNNIYGSVTDALDEVAFGNGATDHVKLVRDSFSGGKTEIIEAVVFNHPDKTVELQMNGHTLTSASGSTLTVEDGTLTVTGDAMINQTGKAELANSAVVVSGGKVIFEDKLSAEGSTYNNSPAVKADGGEVEFNGDLNLKGGLLLTDDAKLTKKLTQGTFLANGGNSVSVTGSKEYKSLYDLLEEGYGFKNISTGEFVGGYDGVNTLAQDVTIEKHSHSYEPVDRQDYWACECGKRCYHEGGYTGGACSVCGKPCPHGQVTTEPDPTTGENKTVCDDCGLQMLVRIEKKDPTQPTPIKTYSADFEAAMNNAEDGTTITLLADVTASCISISDAKDSTAGHVVTLELNGYSITTGTAGTLIIGQNGVYPNEWEAPGKLIITGNGDVNLNINVWTQGELDLSGWTGGTIETVVMQKVGSKFTNTKDSGTIKRLELAEGVHLSLDGGKYQEIFYISWNDVALKLGDLLEDGYAFKTAAGFRKCTDEVQAFGTISEGYEVVKCPHEEVKDGTCVYCGMQGIEATLEGEAYTDINNAVTDWLNKGGLLKLHSEYPYNENIDFHQAEGKPLTIDLNGYQFNVDKNVAMPKNLMGADLTIMDTSENGEGVFGKLNANEGKLTIESGTLEKLYATIDVTVQPSPVTISLRGGKFTAGAISYRAYKMLEGGYYLVENGNNFVNPGNEDYGDSTKWQFTEGNLYQVKKADITVDGDQEGEVEIGKNQVPFAAAVKVNDDSCTEVQFGWYLVNDTDGKLAKLAEGIYMPLTDGTATYDVTTNGSEEVGWENVALNGTYNLICVVTGKKDGAVQWHTVWKDYQMKITQVNLNSGETKITQKENSGNTQEGGNRLVVQPFTSSADSLNTVSYQFDVTYGGKTLKEHTDYKIIDDSNKAKDAGIHKLTIEGIGNYQGRKTVEWKIEPYVLGEHSSIGINRQYDGTTTVDETVFGVPSLGYFEIDSNNPSNPKLDNTIDSINLTRYVERTDMHFDSAEAGDRTFSFTLTLTTDNFVFDDGTNTAKFTLTTKYTSTVSISKRVDGVDTAPRAKDLPVVNGYAATYTVDLAEMLPELASPMEYGDVQYELNPVSLDSQYYDSGARIEDGKLVLPILESQKTGDADVGTITVKAISNNITDITLTINVKATDKIVPTGKPTLSRIAITYGDALSTITLSGTMTDPTDSAKTVTGTFEWVSPEKTMDAVGTYEAKWKFTPDNAGVYAETTGTVTITVDKATPAGAPKYTTINASGRKLSDAALTVNDNWPAGKLEWVDEEGNALSGDTEVKVNTIYKWRFTPTDSNYNTLNGEVELYHVDAPAISVQPQNASVKAGEKAVFEVTATGTALMYQWKINRNDGKGFVDINGADSASYTSGVTDTDCNGFQYYCVISNAAGSVTTATVTLTVTVQYDILDGADSSWTENTDGSLAIRGSGAIGKFLRVLVDGKVVDPVNYTATEGSTIITLKAEYLKTLPEGSHSFEIVWTDGTASTSFTVARNTSGNNGGNNNGNNSSNNNNNSNNDSSNNAGSGVSTTDTTIKAPKTGDTLNDALWIILLAVASIAGAAEVFAIRRKRNCK